MLLALFEVISDSPPWVRKTLAFIFVLPYVVIVSAIEITKELWQEKFY